MIVNRITKIVLITLSVVFVALEVLKYEIASAGVCAIMCLLLTFLYCSGTRNKQSFFFYFLITFSFSIILDFISRFVPLDENSIDFTYYVGNILFIVSYIFLIYLSIKSMGLKEIVSKFSVTIVILAILIVFSVTLITETTQNVLTTPEYILEFVYNAVIMVLLSVSLINYMYRDDYKAMLFFIGSTLIFFSEIIQLAYYYIDDMEYLAAAYSIFLVLGFMLFYQQSQLELKDPEPFYLDEQLEA